MPVLDVPDWTQIPSTWAAPPGRLLEQVTAGLAAR